MSFVPSERPSKSYSRSSMTSSRVAITGINRNGSSESEYSSKNASTLEVSMMPRLQLSSCCSIQLSGLALAPMPWRRLMKTLRSFNFFRMKAWNSSRPWSLTIIMMIWDRPSSKILLSRDFGPSSDQSSPETYASQETPAPTKQSCRPMAPSLMRWRLATG